MDHGVENALRMTVGGVDDNHVDSGPDQSFEPFFAVIADPDRRPHPQPSEVVLAGVGILADFFDVLDGDQPLEGKGVVDHQQLFDTMQVQVIFSLLQGRSRRHGDQLVLGHHVGDRLVQFGFETQVAIGQNTDQLAILGDGNPGDAVFLHQLKGLIDFLVGMHRDRVDNHAAFRLLDLVDFEGLHSRRHVFVQDAETPFPGHADGGPVFGDGIHGGGKQGNVEFDFGGQLSREVDFFGEYGRMGGNK